MQKKHPDFSARTYWERTGRGLYAGAVAKSSRELALQARGTLPAADENTCNCPEGFVRHVIRRGESLLTIANKYGITLTELLDYNPNINPYFYITGQVLCIPAANPPACTGGTLHSIVAGDTLYNLGLVYGVTVERLLAANPGIDPQNLIIGQIICIPPAVSDETGPAPAPDTPDAPDTTPPAEMPACLYPDATRYTVVADDTLISLLIRFNISYAAFEQNNPGVDLFNLTAGATLCVPPSGSRGNCAQGAAAYRVEEGETISSLAMRYNTSAQTLMTLNPTLTPLDFAEGQIICLPIAR